MRRLAAALLLATATLVPSAVATEAPRTWALLVGCGDYPFLARHLGPEAYEARVRLHGPGADVRALEATLVATLGVAPERITVLSGWADDAPLGNPTRENVLRALVRLSRAVAPGDRAIFHFAGHGSRVPDLSGDEADGLDEVLLAADVRTWDGEGRRIPGAILDDEIGVRLRAIRDAGATVWAIFDCCHAGTMIRGGDGALRVRRLAADVLGVPAPSIRGGFADRGGLVEGGELGGLVATYAARADQRSAEMRLPRGAADSPWRGLLTWALVEDLLRTKGAGDVLALDGRLRAAFLAASFQGAAPFSEGDVALSPAGPGATTPRSRELPGLTLPDPRLRVAIVDAEGRPRVRKGPPPDPARVPRATVPDALASDARFPLVERSDDADWLVVDAGALGWTLRPAGLGDGPDEAFAGGADAATLVRRLEQIARVENLKKLAATQGGRGGDLELVVALKASGKDAVGEGATLADGGTLRPGDTLRIDVRNGGPRALDAWVLLLDAAYGVSTVFPAEGSTARLRPGEAAPTIEAFVQDASLGQEHLLVICVPADATVPPIDLRWLEASPLDAATLRARAPAGGAALGEVLAAYAFPRRDAARAPSAAAASAARLALRTWTTAWGPVHAPAFPAGAAARSGPTTPAEDARPARLAGPRVATLRSSTSARGLDVVLSGRHEVEVVGIEPRGTLPELADTAAVDRALATGALRTPYLVEFGRDRRIAAYDTDLDGAYDLRLVDLDGDGFADVRETASRGATGGAPPAVPGWTVEAPVHVPWLRAAHLRWADPALAERAVTALGFLAPPTVDPPVGTADDAAAVAAALDDAAASTPGRARAIAFGRRLWSEGRLRPALRALAERAHASRPGVALPPEALDGVLRFVGAQLWLEGLHPTLPSLAAPSWEALAREHAAFVAASGVPRAERSLENPAYVAELEAAGGAPFTAGNAVEVLVDGPRSWAVREPLLAGAKREILLATWAIYDDLTGRAAADALLAGARRGVAVRVVVDGQTASLPPYRGAVADLSAATRGLGLVDAVTTWRDAARPFDGMHRKLLIVDGTDLVIGGLNFGDAYSHRNPADTRRWRDTDVHVRGPAVTAARALFARRFGAGREAAVADAGPVAAGTERVAVVDHAPGDDDPVLRSLLKAFDGARTSIDVENAYVVRIPSIEAALGQAVRRGVRVRILTNSATSIDEPIVAHGVVRSAGVLADAGCEVYLRRGTTLHGKFVTIDGVFAQVGSYNLHPRSHRLEGETVVNILGAATARRLEEVFARDLEASDRVRSSSEIVVPSDALGRFAWVLCPDLL